MGEEVRLEERIGEKRGEVGGELEAEGEYIGGKRGVVGGEDRWEEKCHLVAPVLIISSLYACLLNL